MALIVIEGLDGDISKKTQQVLIRILLDIDGKDVISKYIEHIV